MTRLYGHISATPAFAVYESTRGAGGLDASCAGDSSGGPDEKPPVKIVVKTGEGCEPVRSCDYCRIINSGHVWELKTYRSYPRGPDAVRIEGDTYARRSTGEVFHAASHAEDKSESYQSVRHTLARLRRIINCNCMDPRQVAWVTLTYAQPDGQPMRDTKRVYTDYKSMWRRLQKWLVSRGHEIPKYITVMEPQETGSWHLHCVWIWPDVAPVIPKNQDVLDKYHWPPDTPTLESMWGQGYVRINRVRDDCDNLGAYMSAYLADLPQGDGKDKRYIKGGRLKYYPSGVNLYRCSRDIDRPEDLGIGTYAEKRKELPQNRRSTYKRSVSVCTQDVVSGGERVANVITTQYYTTAGMQNQDV